MPVIRYFVRVRADVRWTFERQWQIGNRLQKLLQADLDAGAFVVEQPEAVTVTEVQVTNTAATAPIDPEQAANEGFLAEENPYPPNTKKHRVWAREFAEASKWTAHYGRPSLFS